MKEIRGTGSSKIKLLEVKLQHCIHGGPRVTISQSVLAFSFRDIDIRYYQEQTIKNGTRSWPGYLPHLPKHEASRSVNMVLFSFVLKVNFNMNTCCE